MRPVGVGVVLVDSGCVFVCPVCPWRPSLIQGAWLLSGILFWHCASLGSTVFVMGCIVLGLFWVYDVSSCGHQG